MANSKKTAQIQWLDVQVTVMTDPKLVLAIVLALAVLQSSVAVQKDGSDMLPRTQLDVNDRTVQAAAKVGDIVVLVWLCDVDTILWLLCSLRWMNYEDYQILVYLRR